MFAVTERLLLRPLWPEDAPTLHEGLGNWNVTGNLGTAPWPYTRAHADDFIAAQQDGDPFAMNAAIFLRTEDGPRHVGGVGVNRASALKGLPELGYWVAEPFWGRGIAIEAARAVLDVAFFAHRFPVVCGGHYADNLKSGRVLQKLGFRPTGEVLRYPSVPRGRDVDSVEYALTREDWLRGDGEGVSQQMQAAA